MSESSSDDSQWFAQAHLRFDELVAAARARSLMGRAAFELICIELKCSDVDLRQRAPQLYHKFEQSFFMENPSIPVSTPSFSSLVEPTTSQEPMVVPESIPTPPSSGSTPSLLVPGPNTEESNEAEDEDEDEVQILPEFQSSFPPTNSTTSSTDTNEYHFSTTLSAFRKLVQRKFQTLSSADLGLFNLSFMKWFIQTVSKTSNISFMRGIISSFPRLDSFRKKLREYRLQNQSPGSSTFAFTRLLLPSALSFLPPDPEASSFPAFGADYLDSSRHSKLVYWNKQTLQSLSHAHRLLLRLESSAFMFTCDEFAWIWNHLPPDEKILRTCMSYFMMAPDCGKNYVLVPFIDSFWLRIPHSLTKGQFNMTYDSIAELISLPGLGEEVENKGYSTSACQARIPKSGTLDLDRPLILSFRAFHDTRRMASFDSRNLSQKLLDLPGLMHLYQSHNEELLKCLSSKSTAPTSKSTATSSDPTPSKRSSSRTSKETNTSTINKQVHFIEEAEMEKDNNLSSNYHTHNPSHNINNHEDNHEQDRSPRPGPRSEKTKSTSLLDDESNSNNSDIHHDNNHNVSTSVRETRSKRPRTIPHPPTENQLQIMTIPPSQGYDHSEYDPPEKDSTTPRTVPSHGLHSLVDAVKSTSPEPLFLFRDPQFHSFKYDGLNSYLSIQVHFEASQYTKEVQVRLMEWCYNNISPYVVHEPQSKMTLKIIQAEPYDQENSGSSRWNAKIIIIDRSV